MSLNYVCYKHLIRFNIQYKSPLRSNNLNNTAPSAQRLCTFKKMCIHVLKCVYIHK